MNDEASKAKAQRKTNSLFVLACSRGYLDDVKGLLEKGAVPEAVDKRNVSALHYACGQGRLGVVQYLWSRGIELDTEDPAGNSPLHYAVVAGKSDVVEFLLGKGVWVEGSNDVDDSVLHIAARKGYGQMVSLILEHGGKPILRDVNKRGLTALGEAVVAGHADIAGQLIKAGAKVGSTPSGWSLLHLAVALSKNAAVALLADKVDSINDAGNEDQATPLHTAAAKGNKEAADCLVKAGADLALADRHGKQAQDYVAEDNKDLKRLIATKAKPKSSGASQPQGAGVPMNDLDEFKALDQTGRMARVEKWAGMNDANLEAATSEFPLEVCTQIAELKKLRQILNIQEAVVELLEDDDFQQVACSAKGKAIVEEVNQDRDSFRKYAENKAIMDFLRTLQRFHGVVRTNGGHNVPFQSVIRTAEDDYQGKSVTRLKGMRMMSEARKRAVIAAALAGNENAAKKAAERELDPNQQPKPPPQAKAATPAAASTARGGAGAGSSSGGDDLIGSLPPRRPWSWQAFRQEMVRALVQSLLMLVFAVIVLYFFTGRFPWSLADPPLQEAAPEAGTPVEASRGTDYEF